jgi:glycosyltransferase involved in cell wall biosynthesis
VQHALRRLESFLMRRIDLVITVGEKLRRHLAERGARRSVVIGNWKRASEFTRTAEQNAAVRRRLKVPDGALLVTCVTHLVKRRKVEELAAAANSRIIYPGFVSGPEIADFTCAADVIYYGFDPTNPNARFSAPNKLFEALAAGRPLITGDFGEIADVVREAKCGVVLPDYTVTEIQKAFSALADQRVRQEMADNAARMGRDSMNWDKGEDILYREYSAFLPGLRAPGPDRRQELAPTPVVSH